MTRLLITLALWEVLIVGATYLLDWLQGPVTEAWCYCEEWGDAIKGWWLKGWMRG